MCGKLRGIRTRWMFDVLNWARRLALNSPHPVASNVRFGIGIYQLHQGVGWKGTISESESLAAAAIHFLTAVEMIKEEKKSENLIWIMPEVILMTDLEKGYPYEGLDFRKLLCNISLAQQHIHYGVTTRKSLKRASRFRHQLLVNTICEIVTQLTSAILPEDRIEAFYEAMECMTGAL